MKKPFSRCLSLLLSVSMLLSLLPFGVSAYDASEDPPLYEVVQHTTQTLAPGVEQYTDHAKLTDGEQVVYYVTTADLARDDVIAQVAYQDMQPEIYGCDKLSNMIACANEKFTNAADAQFISENYAVVSACNGASFNLDTGEPVGVFAMGGVIQQEWDESTFGAFLAILTDGSAVIGASQEEWDACKAAGIRDAIGTTGDVLVWDDNYVAFYSSGSRTPRTMVGVTEAGELIIAAVDGGQDVSAGVNRNEMARIMFEAGCVRAFELDGGGSTVMMAKNEGEDDCTILNHPSDGDERAIGNAILIASLAGEEADSTQPTATPAPTPEPTPLVSDQPTSTPMPGEHHYQFMDDVLKCADCGETFTGVWTDGEAYRDGILTGVCEYATENGVITYSSTTGRILSYSGSDEQLEIPAEIDGTPITAIAEKAFYQSRSLIEVKLPEGLTVIAFGAFAECQNLCSITLPSSLKRIENDAFYCCYDLCEADLPEGLTRIGSRAFYNCTIKRLDVPQSLQEIGSQAFYNCYYLTAAYFYGAPPENVADDAFIYCGWNFMLYYPEGADGWTSPMWNGISAEPYHTVSEDNVVEYDVPGGKLRFDKSSGGIIGYTGEPTELVIPAEIDGVAVEIIAAQAFAENTSIERVILPESVRRISSSAFLSCTSLKELSISNSESTIGDYAFTNCTSLSNLTLPEWLVSIGNYAFCGDTSLTTLEMPDCMSIGDYAFAECRALTAAYAPYGIMMVSKGMFAGCSSLEDIWLNEYVTSIGDYAFENCSCLYRLNLPEGLNSIGSYAFSGTGLWSIVTAEDLTSIADSTLNNYYGYYYSLMLPESLTEIGERAFAYCENLHSVSLPKHLTTLSEGLFSGCTYLNSVKLPEQLTAIEPYAFYSCSWLKAIRIPNSVKSIGNYAFSQCTHLADVVLPRALTVLPVHAFSDCTALKSVTIPYGVTHIMANAFSGCTGLKELLLSESVSYLGNSALYNCKALESCALPRGLETVGQRTFQNCTGLKTIAFSDRLTSIGAEAFKGCSNLSTADFDGKVPETFGDNVFSGCANDFVIRYAAGAKGWTTPTWNGYNTTSGQTTSTSTTEYYSVTGGELLFDTATGTILGTSGPVAEAVIPEKIKGITVTAIAPYAFSGRESLTRISLPDTVTSIGVGAFAECGWLEAVKLPEGLTEIASGLFSNCSSLNVIAFPESVKSIGPNAFYGCSSIRRLVLHEGLETLGQSAFEACTALTNVDIHSENLVMENYVFAGCKNLEGVYFYANQPSGSSDTCFYGCSEQFSIYYNAAYSDNWSGYSYDNLYYGYSLKSFFFDEQEDIAYYFVSGGRLLFDKTTGTIVSYIGSPTNIEIPASIEGTPVTAIGDSAFYNCDTLTGITLPDSLTSIGEYAFSYTALTGTLHLPDSVTKIGQCAFSECYSLSGELILPSSLETIEYHTFYNCRDLSGVLRIPDSVTRIGSYAFTNCNKLTGVEFGSGVTSIGDSAFAYCYALTGSITLPQGLTEIAPSTFSSCRKLSEIVLPETVTRIGNGAFYFCRALERINLPQGVTSIGNYAFYGCEALTDLILPEGLLTISTEAFRGCSALESIVLPESLTSIGNSAFYGCTALEQITIPEGLTGIGNSTFYNCSALKAVFFSGDAPTVGTKAFPDSDDLTLYFIHGRYGWTKPEWNGYHTEEIISDPNLHYYEVSGGAILYSDETGHIIGFSGKPITAMIPAQIDGTTITGIDANAFSGCSTLNALYVPITVTEIDEDAFADCDGFALISAADSVTAQFADAHDLPFVTTGIDAVSPASYSTIGGVSASVKVTMEASVDLPVRPTLENHAGETIPLPYIDAVSGKLGQTIHTYTLDLTDVESGTYTLHFDNPDYGTHAEAVYSIDRTAPAQPKNFIVTPGVLKNILTWDTAVEADVTYIRIYHSTDAAAEPTLLKQLSGRTTVTYTDSAVNTDTDYFYYISFVDRFGQESVKTGPVGSRPDADTEPPMITGVTPANGSTLTGSVRFSVTAADNCELRSIAMEVSLDGESGWETLSTVNTASKAAFTLVTTDYDASALYVRYLLADIYGNEGYSEAVYRYSIDNTPPEQVSGVWGESTATTITLHWDDVQAQDFSYFLVSVQSEDGTYKQSIRVDKTLGTNLTGLTPDSAFRFRVAACDIHGNLGEYSDTVTVSTQQDRTAPVITAMQPAAARYRSTIPLVFTVYDDYGVQSLTVQTSYDGTDWTDVGTVNTSTVSTSTTLRYSLATAALEEGRVYVRGIATDRYGNDSDRSDGAPYVQYMIDRTAPAAPQNLTVSAVSGVAYLTWTQGTEPDLNGYTVYRAEEEAGPYTTVKTGLKKLSYTDSAVTEGKTYYYRLSCADTAGNVSAMCDPVAVRIETVPDTAAPQIISISPSEGYVLGADTPIKVKVSDDQVVMQLRVSYSTDQQTWTALDPIEVNASTSIVTLPLTAAQLTADKLSLRASCTDGAQHESETYTRTYTIDKTPPAEPTVTAKPDAMRIALSWTCGDEPDLAGFYIYRRADGESAYRYLTQCGKTTRAYTDAAVSVSKGYSYYVTAVDQRGNTADGTASAVVQPLDLDTVAPTVRASGDTAGTVGIEMKFSAAQSTDNVGIASYAWDFGDGATSNLMEPAHAYDAAGSYTVTLTVADAAGNQTTGTIAVKVQEKVETAWLDVTIIDENGAPVSGAGVYINLGAQNQSTVYTNAQGKARVTSSSGTYDIGAYKSGYLPAKKSVKLINGAVSQLTMTIVQSDIVVGELTVERMTLAEIRAAGINTADPANQEVFRYEITLIYGTEKVTVSTVSNKDGETLIDPKPVSITTASGDTRVIYPFVFSGTGSTNLNFNGTAEKSDLPLVAVIDLPGETSWLKDFFDVRLYVLNQADQEFVLDDCMATLNLPRGLTLVDSNRTGTDAAVSMGSIAGRQSATAEWIIRGDKAGEYTLSADFSATLRDFNEPIRAVFEASEPIRVRNGDNLFMDVMVESAIMANADGAIRVGLRNEDSEPYYLPNIALQNVIFVSSFKTAGLVTVDTDKEVLAPGEELWFDYIIPRENWDALMENEDSDFYLIDQFHKVLSETELQVNFIEVQPFTIAADKLEVYQVDPVTDALQPIQMLNLHKDSLFGAQMPDLVIKTYRLNASGVYEPCSMEITIQDEYRMDHFDEEAKTVTTDADGVYRLSGYDITQFYNTQSYTLTISARRARALEIPMVIRGETVGTGYLEVYVGTMKDGMGVPVSGATVTVDTKSGKTDKDGYVLLKALDKGYQTIRIEADGYLPVQQLIKISSATENTFFLTKDDHPDASRVTGVTSSLLDPVSSNYTIIPYGTAEGIATFELQRRIAPGETFLRYVYTITNADGKITDGNTFTSDTFLMDVSKLNVGDTLSFAVETDAGVSVYTPVNIRVVEAPNFILSLLKKAIDITGSWNSKASDSVDLTNFEGKKLNSFSSYNAQPLLANFTGGDQDENTRELSRLVGTFSSTQTDDKQFFPLSVNYDPSGKLTVSFVYGAKESITKTSGAFVTSESMFAMADDGGKKYGVSAKLTLDLIFSYDAIENHWKLRVLGTENGSGSITIAEAPTKVLLASLELKLSETGKWELLQTDVGLQDSTEILRALDTGMDSFSLKGSVKASLGLKLVSKDVAKVSAYVEGSITGSYSKYWKITLGAEVGHEESVLVWTNSGTLADLSWEVYTQDTNIAAKVMRKKLAAAVNTLEQDVLDDAESELTIEPITNTAWTGAANDGVLADNVYSGCDPQIVSLPDGRSLMVFIDTDASCDRSNPTVLKYSVCEDGVWSSPQRVSSDGTVDLYPSLTETDDGASVVWIDLSDRLKGAETEIISAIRETVYPKMTVSAAHFDAENNVWSEPERAAAPGMLTFYPVVCAGQNETMVVWLQNAENTERASADAPDSIACAILTDAGVQKTETILTAPGAIDALDVHRENGAYVITYQITDSDGAALYSLRRTGGTWSSAQRISYMETDTAAASAAADGTLYYTAGSRLYAKRSGKLTELRYSDLLAGAQALDVLTTEHGTYFVWAQSDETVNRMCVCRMDASGAVSAPTALVESDAEIYGAPKLAQIGDGVSVVWVSNRFDESFHTVAALHSLALVEVCDLAVDAVDDHLLYPGAAVTSYYDCSNRALLTVDRADVCISADPTGEHAIATFPQQPLHGAVSWTVPADYDGAPLYLVALPASVADSARSNNFAPAGTPAADAAVSAVRALGTRDGETLLKVTLSNNGAVTAMPLTLTITDPLTGEVFATETIDALSAGESMDRLLRVSLGDCDYIAASVTAGNGDLLEENNVQALYLDHTLPLADMPTEIEAQPEDQYVRSGDTAEFAVRVTGNDLRCQWQFKAPAGDWTDCTETTAGYDTDTISVVGTAGKDGYQYRCVITDAYGGQTVSDAAALTVFAITAQPKAAAVTAQETTCLHVAAIGRDLTYQWQYQTPSGSWTDCSAEADGYNTSTLTVSGVNGDLNRNGYRYRCVVTSGEMQCISDAATLTVFAVTAQPKSAEIMAGETANFTVAATGVRPAFQWQYKTPTGDWTDCTAKTAGYNTDTLSVIGTAGRDSYQYRCVITDGDKTLTSSAAALTVFAIKTQPTAKQITATQTATFTIAATGKNLSYQWQYKTPSGSWTDCSAKTAGYNTPTLTVAGVSGSTNRSGYRYRCVVTSGKKTLTSSAAALTVFAIKTQPTSVEITAGETARFTVAATGTSPAYQWQYKTPTGDWANCTAKTAGYNTAKLSVVGTAGRAGYQYRCVITDGGKTLTTSAVTLTVFAIKTQPSAQRVTGAEKATFTVAATGKNLTYQWQYKTPSGNWTDCTSKTKGYNTPTLTVAGVSGDLNRSGYRYRCVVTSGEKTLTSSAAALTVFAIKTQPTDRTAVGTATAKFAVTVSGAGLQYQWQYKTPGGSWKNCSAATEGFQDAALTVAGVTGSTNRDGYQYRCVITSGSDTLTSDAATLTVFAIRQEPKAVTAPRGETAVFTVSATGDVASYRWQYKTPSGTWKNCTAATEGFDSAALHVAAETKRDGYQYRCVVTDAAGRKITSSAAALTVR